MKGAPTQAGLDVGDVGITQDDLPGSVLVDGVPGWPKLDLGAWFDGGLRGQPVELEIGSGKGTFILNQAKAAPGVNFVGIEYARAFWKYAADRVRRHGVRNVKLLHTEAGSFVQNYVKDGALQQVHIYFPDPWPKKRHNKRRLVQEGFLREVHRVLRSGDTGARSTPTEVGVSGAILGPGRLRIATDHADYFAWMEEHVGKVADLFERLPFESPAPGGAAGEGELVGTNFERKYRREGRSFHGMVLVKRG